MASSVSQRLNPGGKLIIAKVFQRFLNRAELERIGCKEQLDDVVASSGITPL
jgi:hypothetical protein